MYEEEHQHQHQRAHLYTPQTTAPCSQQEQEQHTIDAIDIIPCALPAHHVLDLLALHRPPLVVPPVQHVLVRAAAALEAVLAAQVGVGRAVRDRGVRDARDRQRVAAGGADCEDMARLAFGSGGRVGVRVCVWRKHGC